MDSESPLVFSGDLPSSTVSNMVARGDLVRVAHGIYVRNGHDPERVLRSRYADVAARLVPNAVVSDRSAPTGTPIDGVLYLVRQGSARDINLPGLTIRVRSGAGPQHDDVPLPSGLRLASPARGLAENCLESRVRKHTTRRTLSEPELGDWVDRLCRNDGEPRLGEYRRRVEELAPILGVPADRLVRVRDQIGIALGTRPIHTESRNLAGRRRGHPVDAVRIARFEVLVNALRGSEPQNRPAPKPPGDTFEPFAEAYFSNFIEGTEFEFDEAARIVFDGEMPANRPADAHDILGTYRLLSDRVEMSAIPADEDEFLEVIKRRHRRIMEGRPDVRPGVFKVAANRVGGTPFVHPEDTEGTLRAGWRLRQRLDSPWERALYMAFVVAEVHPFNDGNGRVARAMMTSELEVGAQSRIIIPTVFRDDYVDGLRLLSRKDQPGVFIRAMRYAHDFTASVDYSAYAPMKKQLEEANAFEEPNSPNRLRVLRRGTSGEAAPWRLSPVDQSSR